MSVRCALSFDYCQIIKKALKVGMFKSNVIILSIVKFWFVLVLMAGQGNNAHAQMAESNDVALSQTLTDKNLRSGWYDLKPYQFRQFISGQGKLTGVDIELTKILSSKAGYNVQFYEQNWYEHLNKIATGDSDLLIGATFSDTRAEFARFSEPYRYEENSLFLKKDNDIQLNFTSIAELLTQIRNQSFRLGVIRGFIYADPQINQFIDNIENKDIIKIYYNEQASLDALINDEIDGYITDRIIGAAILLDQKMNSKVAEINLNIKVPIRLMFSKHTVSDKIVEEFNKHIRQFSKESDYKNIIKSYLYPVLLMYTLDSDWFYYLGIIGTIAFAFSGLSIAARENATLFGTLLYAIIPSIGGTILRDVMLSRDEMGIFLTPSYIYIVLLIVVIGFFTLRILEHYNNGANEEHYLNKFWQKNLIISDTIGQTALFINGVAMVVIVHIEPIELWGAFFAFLTAHGGIILRDLLRRESYLSCMGGALNAEITIIWGVIFSIFLNAHSYNPEPSKIKMVISAVIIGALATKLIAYLFVIKNIRVRNGNS